MEARAEALPLPACGERESPAPFVHPIALSLFVLRLAVGRVGCYEWPMTVAVDKSQKTILVPVTTMEEVQVLSAEQRAELLASLAEAEREIAEGRGAPTVTFAPALVV